MTEDEEKLQKFLDCTDSKKARTILESLDDWMLAGLVIWQEVNKTQKNWITKKLSEEPMEMFLKCWENKKIKKNSILTKTGHFAKFSKPEIQVTKANCTCRGHEMGDIYEPVNKDTLQYVKKNPWGSRPRERSFKHSNLDYRLVKQISNDTKVKKCTGGVERGNIRLSIRLVNPAKPYYIGRDWESGRPASGYHLKVSKVTYYYCVHCSSEYISSETRYSLIKKWWPKALKLEREAKEAHIKEQKEKETEKKKKTEMRKKKIEMRRIEKKEMKELGPLIYLADKIVESEWGGAAGNGAVMKKMAVSMKTGTVSNDILEEVLWMYMFHEETDVRAAAKKAFMKLAPEDAVRAVEKNWTATSRKSKKLGRDLGKLGNSLSRTPVGLVDIFVKVLKEDVVVGCRCTPYVICRGCKDKDGCYQYTFRVERHHPTVEALGIIGDARATKPLGDALNGISRLPYHSKAPLTSAISAITIALGKLGEPGIEPLIKVLIKASNSRGGHHDYVLRATSKSLEKLKWKPDTDEHLAVYLAARRKWSECVKLGEHAIDPLIKTLVNRQRIHPDLKEKQGAVKALGEIGNKRAVKPLIKVLAPKAGDYIDSFQVLNAAVKALGAIGDERAIYCEEITKYKVLTGLSKNH